MSSYTMQVAARPKVCLLKGLLQEVCFRLGEAMGFSYMRHLGVLWFLQSAWKLQRVLVFQGWNVSTLDDIR